MNGDFMKKQFLMLSLLAVVSVPALASNFYAVGSIGQSKYDAGSDDQSDTAFSFGAGYKFNNTFALEVGYNDMGEISDSISENLGGGDYYEETYSFGASAVQASLVVSLPLGESASIYGRAGFADIDFDASYEAIQVVDGDVVYEEAGSGTVSENKTVFGLGFSYSFSPAVALRAEYSQYDKWEGIELSTISAGLTYQF
jgi:opacity protein-like surface antigen